MAIKRPDRYTHNNPNLPILYSEDVKGGALKTANLDTLLTDFVGKEAKLFENVTKVYVIDDGSGGADYRLTNIGNVGTIGSWERVNVDTSDLAKLNGGNTFNGNQIIKSGILEIRRNGFAAQLYFAQEDGTQIGYIAAAIDPITGNRYLGIGGGGYTVATIDLVTRIMNFTAPPTINGVPIGTGGGGGTNKFADLTDDARDNASLAGYLDAKADLVGGLVPSSQLPAYVDDVIEGYKLSTVFYEDAGHTIAITGEVGKIYVDLTSGQSNKQYRWSGSAYIQITNGLIASTADVPDSTDKRYVTDAQRTVIGNTSGVNTGDETATTLGATVAGADNNSSPLDTALFFIRNSTTGLLNKLTYANLKVNLKTWIEATVFATIKATKGLFGTTTAKNAHITVGASTSTLATEHKDWGVAYTGTEAGAEWKETTGFRKFLKRDGATDEYLFMGANPALAGTGVAIPLLAADGSLTRGGTIKENTTLSGAVITAITGASYTTDRATITPAGGDVFYMGQMYDDGTYTYIAIANNSVRRY